MNFRSPNAGSRTSSRAKSWGMAAGALATILLPTAALAHTGIGGTSGFAHGFSHPLGGLDHVLAMVLIGVFAFRLGGRALWLVPATFVTVMVAGGLLGALGVGLPFVETGIALSVVVLGVIVALGVRAPVAVAMGMAGLFALCHGHAHGAEMPEDVGGLAYAAGFVLATALLHAGGIALGWLVGRAGQRYGLLVTRLAGGLAALAGVGLLVGAF